MTGLLPPPDLETGSVQYARRFAGPSGAYLLDIQERGLRDLVDDGPPVHQSALDVGGGHGQLVGGLLGMGLKTTVLGSTADCAEQLFQGTDTGRVDYVTGDLLALPFPDGSFDLVTSIRLLAHIDDPDKLMDELCRVARYSVIIDYPTLIGANALSAATFPIKRLIEKDTRCNGFASRRSFKQFSAPMGLHRLAGKPVRMMEEGLRLIGVTRLIGNPVLQRFDREKEA